MAPSGLHQPLLVQSAESEAFPASSMQHDAAGSHRSSIFGKLDVGVQTPTSEAEILTRKKRHTDPGTSRKAESCIRRARMAAKLSAGTPVAIEGGAAVSVGMGFSRSAGSVESSRMRRRVEEKQRSQQLTAVIIAVKVALSAACFVVGILLMLHNLRCAKQDSSGKAPENCDHILYDFPMGRWLVFVSLIVPLRYCSRVVASLVVTASEFLFSWAQHVLYVLLGLVEPLTSFFTAVSLYVVIVALQLPFEAFQDFFRPSYQVLLSKLVFCYVIHCTIALLTKLACRLLSMHVHADTLFAKLKRAVEQEQVLAGLMGAPDTDSLQPELPRVQAIAHLRDIPAEAVQTYLTECHRASLTPASTKHSCFADHLIRLTKTFEDMSEDELDMHAHNAAEFLWCTVGDPASPKLTESDFEAVLDSSEDARFAFQLFDVNGDGFVVESEVHERFEAVYRHRRHIANTLMDTNEVIGTLESVVGFIMHTLAIFAYLYVFGVQVSRFAISFSTGTVAFAFIFGNSLREVYESLVWLFGVNPYDAGDCLWYNNTFATVDKFGLLNTQLLLTNGNRVWVSNQKLMQSGITNLSDSKPVAVYTNIEVDATIPIDAIDELSVRMQATAAAHEDLFDQTFECKAYVMNIIAPLKYQVELCYKSSATMMQYTRYCAARAAMNATVGGWLQENNVSYSAAYQQAFEAALKD